MKTNGFAVVIVGVMMMTLMWTDVTESKIICPSDDTTLPSYKDMGFVKPVPHFASLRAWLIHRICNKLKLKALFHPTTTTPPVTDVMTPADVNPNPAQGPSDVGPPSEEATTPPDDTAPDNAEKADFLSQLLSRKRRSTYRMRYRHYGDDSDEDDDYDHDDSDSDDHDHDSWRGGSTGYYHHTRHGQHNYHHGRRTPGLFANNRGRYGARGVRYRNNRRWNNNEADHYGYGSHDSDDHDDSDESYDSDQSRYGYDQHDIQYPNYNDFRDEDSFESSWEVEDPYLDELDSYHHGSYGYQGRTPGLGPHHLGPYENGGVYNRHRIGGGWGGYRRRYRIPV